MVIEDGPSITHGGMFSGRQQSPPESSGRQKLWTRGGLRWVRSRETFENYPNLGNQLPSMGYTEQQIRDLEATINGADCDLVVFSTPRRFAQRAANKQAGHQGPLRVQGPLPPVPGKHSRSKSSGKRGFCNEADPARCAWETLYSQGRKRNGGRAAKKPLGPRGPDSTPYFAIPGHNHSWKRPAGGATSSPAGMLQPGAEDASLRSLSRRRRDNSAT